MTTNKAPAKPLTNPSAIALQEALIQMGVCKDYIRENRGYDKELARESYEHYLGEVLVPAMEIALGDIEKGRDLEKIAKLMVKILEGEP